MQHARTVNGHRQSSPRWRPGGPEPKPSSSAADIILAAVVRGVLFSDQVIGNSFAYTLPVLTDAWGGDGKEVARG